MTFFRRFFVLLSLLTLVACGSSQTAGPGAPAGPAMQPMGALEGNWVLCGEYVNGQHRRLEHRERAYVMRFDQGQFTVPFRGSEGRRLGFPDHAVEYRLNGSHIHIGHRAFSTEMKIVSLDANTLRVQANDIRGNVIDLEFHRIDDQTLAQMPGTSPY